MAFIRKRADTYYIYWQQDGKKRAKSLKTKSKQLAQTYLRQFEYQLAQRRLGQQADITLAKLEEEYLSYAKDTVRESTYVRSLEPRVKRFISFLAGQGVTRTSEMTQAHAERYQQYLLPKYSTSSVRNCMYMGSGLLSFAVRRGYLDRNVIKAVQKVKPVKNPPRFLSFEEWDKVRETAEKTYLWPLVAAAYYTGFRNSELRYLTWPEIDFERSVITLTNKDGFTLKSRHSRTVPLNADLAEVLRPLAKERGYCFLNRKRRQFDATELTREFAALVATPSGLPHFTLHTLRHTFASHLVMKGVSIYKVSQWLGHSTVNTTMIYAHLAPQDDQINVL